MSDRPQEQPNEGKPRGKSLRWTAEDIAELSKVGPEDMLGAKAAWRKFAPKLKVKLSKEEEAKEISFKTLLDAKEDRSK
jgi:hypothetical protein